jgi:hypothetical protein
MAATTRQSLNDAVFRLKLFVSAAGIGGWLGACAGAALAAHVSGGIHSWWGVREWAQFVVAIVRTGNGYFLWGGALAGAALLLLPVFLLLRPRRSRPTTAPASGGRGPINPL